MTIQEDFDYTCIAANGAMLSLEVRRDQSLSLLSSSPSMNAVAHAKPTREQWLEFRAVLNHVLDAEDVTAASAVAAKGPQPEADPWPPNTAEQKATFERWLDKHTPLDDTDLNDPESI